MKGISARALGVGILSGASVAGFLAIGAAPASAATTASVQDRVLHITGDRASDKVALVSSDPTTLVVDVGEDGTAEFTFDTGTFDAVDVEAGAGDDEVRVTNGALTGKAVTIDGGAGDDTLLGGDESDAILGGTGDDFVDGNRGADTAQLGSGGDTFQWDPGDGSDVVDGQGGHDTLAFNGSNAAESIDLTANGSRARLHRDVADVTMDLGTIESVDLRALGSADTIRAGDLTGTGVQDFAVDPGGEDGAADRVIVDGTAGDDDITAAEQDGATAISGIAGSVHVTGAGPGDAVRVDGGDGTDTVHYEGTAGPDDIGIAPVDALATAFGATGTPVEVAAESLVVDGLDGDDRIAGQNGLAAAAPVTIEGDAGNDTLGGTDGNDALDGGRGDDLVDGNRGADVARLGSGDDTFQWDPGDGGDTIEGQAGHDRLAFNGSNVAESIALSANGGRLRLTRDIGAVTMDAGGVEDVAVTARAGADTIEVGDLRHTDVSTAHLDISSGVGGGDGAADTVIVDGTDRPDHVRLTPSGDAVAATGLAAETDVTGGEPALDTLKVQTAGGRDDVTVAPGVSDLIQPLVDLGADQ